MHQVLLAVGCGWLLCFILTEADALPTNSTDPAYRARTDINLGVVSDAPWFKFPYPCESRGAPFLSSPPPPPPPPPTPTKHTHPSPGRSG